MRVRSAQQPELPDGRDLAGTPAREQRVEVGLDSFSGRCPEQEPTDERQPQSTEPARSQTRSRQKVRNIDNNRHVAISITDPENPYRHLEIRGVVDNGDDDPERAFIDDPSERYLNKRPYPYHQPADERIVVSIRPTGGSAMAA